MKVFVVIHALACYLWWILKGNFWKKFIAYFVPTSTNTKFLTEYHIYISSMFEEISIMYTIWKKKKPSWNNIRFQLSVIHSNEMIYRTGLSTHWGRVTHICVDNLTNIDSDNGLSPGRRQAIIWTNAGILLIWPLGTNFSEILSKIKKISFTKMHLKLSSAKRRPFCPGEDELMIETDSRVVIVQAFHNNSQLVPECWFSTGHMISSVQTSFVWYLWHNACDVLYIPKVRRRKNINSSTVLYEIQPSNAIYQTDGDCFVHNDAH